MIAPSGCPIGAATIASTACATSCAIRASSLMFMVPGCSNVVRANGTAYLTDDPSVTGSFEQAGKHPKLVIVMALEELYLPMRQGDQCARRLWAGEAPDVPTAGQFVKEVEASFDADAYDDGYAEYAKPRMW